jgi:hypothetical protein
MPRTDVCQLAWAKGLCSCYEVNGDRVHPGFSGRPGVITWVLVRKGHRARVTEGGRGSSGTVRSQGTWQLPEDGKGRSRLSSRDLLTPWH